MTDARSGSHRLGRRVAGRPTAAWGVLVRDNLRPSSPRRCGCPVPPRGGASPRSRGRPGRPARSPGTRRGARSTRRSGRDAGSRPCGSTWPPPSAWRARTAAASTTSSSALVAGGVRALLDARGEPVERLRPRAGIAVALFSPGRATRGRERHRHASIVPLPIGEPDPAARLPLIAAERGRGQAKPDGRRRRAGPPGVVRALRRVPARDGAPAARQPRRDLPARPARRRSTSSAPRVLDLLPIAPLAGNLGLSFVALSYAGRLTVTVRADADQFPDLDVLVAAMERDWQTLAGSVAY